MNQQNKTERWEELKKDFNRVVNKYFGEVSCRCGSKESVILEPKEFTEDMWSFILQLLSDARREERERCLEENKKLKEFAMSYSELTEREFDTRYEQHIKVLTTAEESIKIY